MEPRLKRLPAIWETWVRSLGQEDPLEKEILLCLATMWLRPVAILLELDFLSLCLETRALRNIYLTLRKKEKKDLKLDLALCLSKYVLVIFLWLICI